jgi:hypothetical protein
VPTWVFVPDGHGRGEMQARLERAMLDEALAQLGDGRAWPGSDRRRAMTLAAGLFRPPLSGLHFSGTTPPQVQAATVQLSGWEALARDLMLSAERSGSWSRSASTR